MINYDLLHFLSANPIDKVVDTGQISIVNDGDTTPDQAQKAKVVTDQVANSYGKKVFARARWSIDGGTTWQSLDSRLLYIFTLTIPAIPISVELQGLDGAVSIGVSDNFIKFRTANGKHGSVSQTLGGSQTYTPTSHTFLIQYAIFEVEP